MMHSTDYHWFKLGCISPKLGVYCVWNIIALMMAYDECVCATPR